MLSHFYTFEIYMPNYHNYQDMYFLREIFYGAFHMLHIEKNYCTSIFKFINLSITFVLPHNNILNLHNLF